MQLLLHDQCFGGPTVLFPILLKAPRVERIIFKATGLKVSYIPNPTRLTGFMMRF